MRRLIFAFVVFSLFFSIPFSYSQELSDWEWRVYYDIVERWHELYYDYDDSWSIPQKEFDNLYSQIAEKYAISVEEVKKIDDTGINREPTDREYEIYDELLIRFDALPEDASNAELKRVHREVANEFGISLIELHEIEYRMEEGFWFF